MSHQGSLLKNHNLWAAVIIAAIPLILPEALLPVLCVGGVYAIAALGMSLLLGFAGQISLGHAAFLGLGAYTVAILTTRYHWPAFAALAASAVVPGAIAFVIGKPILKTRGFFLALATLGFGEIFYVFISRTDPFFGGLVGIGGIPYFSLGFYELSSYRDIFYLHWAVLLALVIYSQNLVNSRAGRAFRAISTDELAASTMGVDVAAYKLKIFVISAAYAGIGGGLLASYLSMTQPDGFRVTLSLFIVLAVIVGGMGNLWGVVIATVALTWLKDEQLSQYQEYGTLIYGIILILILIFAPNGLGALGQKWFDRLRRAGGRRQALACQKRADGDTPDR
ncbi:MAG: branched-chain amino acid ABC transporter permease [Deltaproteobacteria bacterium]|nr:branched-chain amino acid ABC transporter permease [Deltaproteobacteria bacterium]